MSKSQIERLLDDYRVARYAPFIDSDAFRDVISFGVSNGYLQMLEKKNPYTFGGQTVSLTDSELANVMSLTSRNQKITAIKEIRNASDLSLKEAKHFVDHLSEVMNKMATSGV